MRLDKYLINTRIIKRRIVSSTLINEGAITINGKNIKPSYEVKLHDIVNISLGRHKLTIEVINIKDIHNKEESKDLYKILSDEIINN